MHHEQEKSAGTKPSDDHDPLYEETITALRAEKWRQVRAEVSAEVDL